MTDSEIDREVLGLNFPQFKTNENNLPLLLVLLKDEQARMKREYIKKRKQERTILENFYEPIN